MNLNFGYYSSLTLYLYTVISAIENQAYYVLRIMTGVFLSVEQVAALVSKIWTWKLSVIRCESNVHHTTHTDRSQCNEQKKGKYSGNSTNIRLHQTSAKRSNDILQCTFPTIVFFQLILLECRAPPKQ